MRSTNPSEQKEVFRECVEALRKILHTVDTESINVCGQQHQCKMVKTVENGSKRLKNIEKVVNGENWLKWFENGEKTMKNCEKQ